MNLKKVEKEGEEIEVKIENIKIQRVEIEMKMENAEKRES